MHLFQFVAAWLFPSAVCATTAPASAVATATTAASFEPDRASSPVFSVKAADSASSRSSSSSVDHFSFRTSRQQSPSTSPLCFGAGGAGRLLWGSSRARARASKKQEEEAASSVAPKSDAVGRYLRKISRRLRKARAAKESPPPRGAVDGTAREREEAVASAIAYCKETLQRGTSPPPPSLDGWFHYRQEEIIASATAHSNERRASQPPPLPPRRMALLERQAKGTHCNESLRPPSTSRDGSVSASAVAHGKESPHHGHVAGDQSCGETGESAAAAEPAKTSSPSDPAAGELEMHGSFNEMDFLKTFDGHEGMISRHFVTIQI